MADNTRSEIYKAGVNATDDELLSVAKRFHRDFRMRTEETNALLRQMNQRDIERTKKSTLMTVTHQNVSNVSNIQNFRGADAGKKEFESVMIPITDKSDKNITQSIEGLGSKITDQSQKDTKKQKSIFQNAILQARLVEGAITGLKNFFFGGPTEAEMIINAIENVERAIRDEDKNILDMRTPFERMVDQMPDDSKLKKASVHMPKFGGLDDFFTDLMGTVTAGVTGKNLDTTKIGAAATGFANGMMGAISDVLGGVGGFKPSGKAAKDVKGAASGMMDFVTGKFDEIMNSKFAKSKYAALTGFAMFGDMTDNFIAWAITHPAEALKTAKAGAGKYLQGIEKGSFLGGVATNVVAVTKLYGAQAGVLAGLLSTGLIPMYKLLKMTFLKEMPKMTDIVGGLFSKIKDAGSIVKNAGMKIFGVMKQFKFSLTVIYEDINEMITSGVSTMLGKMKKKVGKAFILAGLGLGALGVKMVGIMSIMIAAGTAAMPFVIGGLILAAVAGIAYWVYNNWDTVTEAFNTYVAEPILNFFYELFQDIYKLVTSIPEKFGNFFSNVMGGIETYIRSHALGGDALADFIFGEKSSEDVAKESGTVIDKSQVGNVNKPIVIDKSQSEKMIAPIIKEKEKKKEEQEDLNTSTLRDLTNVLKYLADSIGSGSDTTPAPVSNIDDIGTYLVTQ